MELCEGCGLPSVTFDVNAGVVVCEGCGLVRQETQFRHSEFDEEGIKSGSYVGGRGTASSLGLGRSSWTLAPGSHIGFRSDYKKQYTLAKLDHLSSLLRLPKDRIDDVKHMLGIITEDKWGAHRWMDILIGTCIYIVARQHRLPLSAAEIATTLNCPIKELLRVYNRVLNFMEIQSTPFDPAVYFDKVMSHHPTFMSMERDAVRRLSKQGHCLLQYGTEWCLSAGRHPLALVAAVAVIVGKANNIKVDMEVVSRDLHVHPATSRLRLKEFMNSLVGFGQRLPWGKDITLKTVSRHLPFLLQYLEARMRMDSNQVVENSVTATTTEASSGEDAALRHIAKALYAKYGPQIRAVLDGQPVDVVKEDIDPLSIVESATGIKESANGIKKRKVNGDAPPCNSLQYSCKEAKLSLVDCSKEAAVGPIAEEDGKTYTVGPISEEEGKINTAAGQHHIGPISEEEGKQNTSGQHCIWKPLPPSFLANSVADAIRTARIQAAKKRIASVKQDMVNQLVRERKQKSNDETASQSIESASSAKIHAPHDKGLDAEDFLIQYCLIRGADEKILQAGYYLLALSTPPVQPDKEIMSDTELLKYFRTPEEIEFLESLSKEEPLYPWLNKDDPESQT